MSGDYKLRLSLSQSGLVWTWLLALLLVSLTPAVVLAEIDADGVGDDDTLQKLQLLEQFEGLDAGQFRGQMWVDPYRGNDRNAGTYEAPLRSLRLIKQECLNHPYMRCTVKGRNRVFSPRTLTITFDSGDSFVVGERVTTTSPIATGAVIGAESEYLVLSIDTPPTNTWGATPSAPEPRVDTVIRGATSGATATVTSFEDTIVGLHSVLFDPGDISIGSPTVITVDHHGYSDMDGPFVWLNQTTMPTTTGVQVVEAYTRLYVCDASTNTFELSTSPECEEGRVGVTSAGEGLNQLVAFHALRSDSDGNISTISAVEMKCDPRDRHRICALFESEFPEAPWIIDGGGFYPGELRALVYPEWWPGAGTGGTYNPPKGYLMGVSNQTPDLSQGWLGVQNGTIQNLSMDGLATHHGGKLIALNVKTKSIRNGISDRSQHEMPNPPYQAHNSCIQATGTATIPDDTGSVVYWLNGGGSWNYQGSHRGSGGCINVNQRGVLRLISRGTISSDAFPGDRSCDGAPCGSSLVVNPHGDMTAVGPLVLSMGPIAERNRFHGSGVGTATRYYKVDFDRLGAYPHFDTREPAFFNFVPLASAETATLELNEVTFRSAGKGTLFNICEAQEGAVRSITGRNVLFVQAMTPTFNAGIADCAASFCDGDCGGVGEAVANTYLSMEGSIRSSGGSSPASYFIQPQTLPPGRCGEPGSFQDEICRILVAHDRPADQWSWFEEDEGPPNEIYMVSLRSETFPEFVDGDSCLPADALGTPVCELRLTEGIPVPEPPGPIQSAAALATLALVTRKVQSALPKESPNL
jgi:hypothetical protein